MEFVPIFLCCYSWSRLVPFQGGFGHDFGINPGYEEKRAK